MSLHIGPTTVATAAVERAGHAEAVLELTAVADAEVIPATRSGEDPR